MICAFWLLMPLVQYTTIYLFLSVITFVQSFLILYNGIFIAPFIWPSLNSCSLLTSISAVIILVYFAIRFKKLGAMKTILGSIISIILSEIFYMAIIAITRYPIDKMVIIGSIAIYIFGVTYLNKSFLLQSEKLTNKK